MIIKHAFLLMNILNLLIFKEITKSKFLKQLFKLGFIQKKLYFFLIILNANKMLRQF